MRILVDESLPVELAPELAAYPLAVIILRARSNSLLHLRPLIASIRQALTLISPGRILRLGP